MKFFYIKHEDDNGLSVGYLYTMSTNEDETKEKFLRVMGLNWEKWAECGYSCVKVKITEI